jgi:hypothetical protein
MDAADGWSLAAALARRARNAARDCASLSTVDLSEPNIDLSEPNIDVKLDVAADGRTLVVSTLMSMNPMSDDVSYDAAYRIFVNIEREIGRISRIQEQP